MTLREYHRPNNIEEASELLARKNISSQPVLLGTYPIPLHERKWEAAIDLSQIGLAYINTDETNLIRIGSLTSLQELVDAEPIQKYANGILSYAAQIATHRGLRNLASVSGTLLSVKSSPELCLALMILEANAISYPDNVYDFPIQPIDLNSDSIITEIRIPIQSVNTSLERVSRTPLDKSIVCSAVALVIQEDNITDMRIAVSGISEQPIAIQTIDSSIVNLSASKIKGTIHEAIKDSADHKYSDYLGSAEYRIEIATILTVRAIKRSLSNQ